MTQYESLSKELIDYIQKSPSSYHAVSNIKTMLEAAGYIELKENKYWSLSRGEHYYVIRNDSSIIAFAIPDGDMKAFNIVAAHSDSPSFKIKNNPEVEKEQYISLNTEKYGGMLMAPWLDRPLSVAGRVIVRKGSSYETRLVNVDRDLLIIPSLAIHMNRDANSNVSYNPQTDMLPLYGLKESKGSFTGLIAKAAGVEEKDICGSDIFLYNRVLGTIWGADNEFISSGRLDDLQCVYAGVKAMLESSSETAVNMCCIFDNEEVGSSTRQGADSDFLENTLKRINEVLGRTQEEYMMALTESFMLSADNAHGVHPNYADKADPTNRPYINGGVVIKGNANQKYTTDAVSYAIFRDVCSAAQVPVQSYVNRSDIAGGSTLGNIANTHVSMRTVDIGLAQLAMHSPYETAGVKDTEYMYRAMKEFYSRKA